jgi:hypothetical protein
MQRLKNAVTSLGSGIVTDIKNRSSTYKDDWRDVNSAKLRILAAGVYIFLASALPALAFGVQFQKETDNILNVVHVLISTAIGGLVQCLIGGQPLLIVGVAEPIVLVYSYMYAFAKDKQELGSERFLAWAAWTLLWAGIIVVLLAFTNACVYISKFTRFAGESFGALIALLFIQQAIKGTVNEFSYPEDDSESSWQLINGLWAVLLAFGLLFSGLAIRQARKWRYLNSPVRAILADYGVPLLVIAWSGLSYAISGPSGDSAALETAVPSRVSAPNTWQMESTSWTVSTQMRKIPGKYIAAALVPGLIIAVLFYFDHNVSSQLAQQEEFNLKRPTAYNWDLFLLGIITITFGVLGLPPINGVIPQSPMHTKALSSVVTRSKDTTTMNGARVKKNEKVQSNGGADVEVIRDENAAVTHSTTTTTNGARNDSKSAFVSVDANDNVIQLDVAEQRGSGLLQSLLLGACLAIMPAIRCIPTSVLWGYFAFMAAESLPGSQLWDRTLLLLTDPKRRYLVLERGHAPYLETVKYKTVVAFTLIQLIVVGAVYGLTWAGIAGVLFPLPIMALVPFRQYILPRWFNGEDLNALDKLKEEEAAPLGHEEAIEVAGSAGLAAILPTGGVGGGNGVHGGGLLENEEMLDNEIHHYRVVHHISEEELVNRRRSAALTRQSAQDGGGGENGNNV